MFEIVPNRKLYTSTWMLSTLLWNNWITFLGEVNLLVVVLKTGAWLQQRVTGLKFGKSAMSGFIKEELS
jgi:hypothetical protein